EPLCLGQLIENRLVDFRKLARNGGCELDQTPAVTRQTITLLDLFFLVRMKLCRRDLLHLMAEQFDLLFACCLHPAQRFFFRDQRLPAMKTFLIFLQKESYLGKASEKRKLPRGKKQCLVTVRPVQLEEFIPDCLQQGKCRRRPINKMRAVPP